MNPDVTYYPKEDVLRAVALYETPFFLYSEKRLRENCRNFKEAFTKYFPSFEPLFAVKANPNPHVLKIIIEEGFGFDVSSEAEVWIVDKIGGKGMHTGNYTAAAEFAFAKEKGMILNLDDLSMLDFFVGAAAPGGEGKQALLRLPETLSFRINPGVGGGSMESLIVAGPDAKYGVPFEKAAEGYRRAKEMGVKHFGIHMMTGSNVGDEAYFGEMVGRLLDIVAEIKSKTGIEIEFLNMGGGFGVPYRPEEKSLDLEKVASGVRAAFDKKCTEHGLKEPRLMAEPGRYIAADMGWLIGKVQVIKDGYKKFVGMDASSSDMPRPSIYGAYHYVSVVKVDGTVASEKEVVSIVGTICENNDQLARDRELPVCEIGDIVAIHNCGGHAYAMGHNYNGKPRSAEYLVGLDGEIRQIRRAETVEDLYRTVIPY